MMDDVGRSLLGFLENATEAAWERGRVDGEGDGIASRKACR